MKEPRDKSLSIKVKTKTRTLNIFTICTKNTRKNYQNQTTTKNSKQAFGHHIDHHQAIFTTSIIVLNTQNRYEVQCKSNGETKN